MPSAVYAVAAAAQTEAQDGPKVRDMLSVSLGRQALPDLVKENLDDPSCHLYTPGCQRQKRRGGEPATALLSPAISSAAPSLALFFRPLVIKTSQ